MGRTPDDFANSAQQLEAVLQGAVRRHGTEAATRDAARHAENLEPVMRELARCANDVIVSPKGQADLGAILIGYQFKAILAQYQLALVPMEPTAAMQREWTRGWFRSFRHRYRAAIKEVWEAEAYPRSR
jgi:hypothetical protein